ncbi:MAG TPA: hypothetical protein VF017_18530 [Thermoanaerobaculia bacterium]|nr:hypothetical protein [Thermoanaerobaculia bacterium]
MAAAPEIDGLGVGTEGPAPAAVPWPATVALFSFERLEYGKLCVSPNGPILPGVEAYPLIRSRSFPPAVEKLCRPWIAGIGSEMLARSPHGTVLRGVRAGDRVLTLAYRLRRRPESGEDGAGRRYWLGRYLCVPAAPPDPLACFRALSLEPLRGVTPAETRAPVRALSSPPAGPPEVDDRVGRFLEQALVFVMSGVPVGITALEEETFFLWAAALWYLLPGPLRPLLSAGWEVHPEQTQRLSLSTSTQFSPTVGVFDPRERRWTPPERMIEELPGRGRGEPNLVPFNRAHLIPGLMYLREAFSWTADGRPSLAPPAPHLGFLEGFDYEVSGPAPAGPPLEDLGSTWCREKLRRAGLRCLDHARLQLLGAWLRDGQAAAPEGLALSTAKYFFPDAKQRVLTVGLQAMADPDLRNKGDRILWTSLLEEPAMAARLSPCPRTAARAHFLQGLALRDLPGVLQSLADGDPAALSNLPPDIQTWLESALEKSLDIGLASLPYHQEILTRAENPEPYFRWATRRAAGLAVLLGTSGVPEAVPALESLDALSRDPLATVFVYLLSEETPGADGLVRLRQLEPRDLERCQSGLSRLWQQQELGLAAHRERLIPWLRAAGPFATPSPLLSILFQGPSAELPAGALERLAQEIEGGGVPPSLEPAVAAVALHRWRTFAPSYRLTLEPWKRIARHWPDEHLVGLGRWLPSRTVPAIEPPREIELDGDRLEIMIRAFHETRAQQKKISEELLARTAALLWGFCRNLPPNVPPGAEAVRLCTRLMQHQVPQRPPKETGELVAALSAMARDEGIPWTDLWADAAHGWQMLFLLECAPWADLQPSVEQLSRLIRYRQDLQRHLQSKRIPDDRKALFQVASWNFQEVAYSQKHKLWRDEFTRTPLWAAFKHLPHALQGSLQEALDAYAAANGDSNLGTLVSRRVKLALAYLAPYEKLLQRDPNNALVAALKVAGAVIAPILREQRLERSQVEILLKRRGDVPPPRRLLRRSPILRFSPHTSTPVQVAGHEILVAPWFYELIEKIQLFDCVEQVIDLVMRREEPTV